MNGYFEAPEKKLHWPRKVVFVKLSCTSIECLDLDPDFFFKFFRHFKICFLVSGYIYTKNEPK
jgi:hypothetical protein